MGYMPEADARKRDGAQLLLRFTEGSDLRETLKRKAALNGRTLTAEIIFRLEQSLVREETNDSLPTANSELAELKSRVDELSETFRHHINWHIESDKL
jgi:hypothetical protein